MRELEERVAKVRKNVWVIEGPNEDVCDNRYAGHIPRRRDIPVGYSGGLASFGFMDEGWSSRERTTRFPPEWDFVPPALMLAETLGGTTYFGPR